MAKHFNPVITDETLAFEGNEGSIRRETDLAGVHFFRTCVPDTTSAARATARDYKSVANMQCLQDPRIRDPGIEHIRPPPFGVVPRIRASWTGEKPRGRQRLDE